MSTPLNSITQDQYSAAEAIVIDSLRTAYPNFDLRQGTALRELLVRPEATISAQRSADTQELQSVMSLSTMAATGTATAAQVDAVLANFNMTQMAGTVATGTVVVKVSTARVYTVGAGAIFTTLSGLSFTTLTAVTAQQTPVPGTAQLFTATDGTFYVLVPVTSSGTGSQYNIASGTALSPTVPLFSFISASAYSPFSGGTDGETIAQAQSRIPAALSHRGLTSRTATEAQLRDNFNGSAVTIQAVSVQGYGDVGQIRDQHTALGISVGSRVDVYTRNFVAAPITTLQYTGTLVSPGVYTFKIPAADAPGFYAIRTISDATGVAVGSYIFTETRGADGLSETFHDIDLNNIQVETAYTVWQNSIVTVHGVPAGTPTYTFKVELYQNPGLQAIQSYMDDPAVRPSGADYLARSPLICLVSCKAAVYYSAANPVDPTVLAQKLAAYINSRSFVARLTRSELISVMLANGVTQVDLGATGMTLNGSVRGADGTVYQLAGDTLDISGIQDGNNLVAPATCVFLVEPQNIVLQGYPQ